MKLHFEKHFWEAFKTEMSTCRVYHQSASDIYSATSSAVPDILLTNVKIKDKCVKLETDNI